MCFSYRSSRSGISDIVTGRNHRREKTSNIARREYRSIFLVKNQQVGPRTKHINVRHHFIRELHEDGSLVVKYTESEDNEADITTKM